MQDPQSMKREIISALDFLSSDSLKLLAKFVAFLRTNAAQPEIDQLNLEQDLGISAHPTGPDLILREQIADFKEVTIETIADDTLTLNPLPSGSPQAILQLTGSLSVEEGEAILEAAQDCRRIDWELWE